MIIKFSITVLTQSCCNCSLLLASDPFAVERQVIELLVDRMSQIDANGTSAAATSTSVLSPAPAQLPRDSKSASSNSIAEHTIEYKLSHPDPQPSNRYSRLIAQQEIATVDHFELENGDDLQDVQVAYKTWGKLNDKRDNCMVICHALTGSADVEDWCVFSSHRVLDCV